MLISISRRKYVGDKHPLYGVHYMWINNGFVNKRFNGNEIPEGWSGGRTR